MLTRIARAALWLDTWLGETLGRPYHFILSVGLIAGIVSGLSELRIQIGSPREIIASVLRLTIEAALLINQIGALTPRLERRAERGLRRGRRRSE